jgi:hypothetical protein
VKLKLENGNVQGERKEKDEKKYIGSTIVLVAERKTYVPKLFILIILEKIRVHNLMGFGWMAFYRISM